MSYRSIRSVPAAAGVVAGILSDLKENVEVLTGQRGTTASVSSSASTVTTALGINIFYMDAYANLSTAITSIGSSVGDLIINKQIIVGSTLTVPSNIHLGFIGQGGLYLSTGITVTIAGAFAFEPSLKQVFYGNGSVVFSSPQTVYPEWWGGVDATTLGLAQASLVNGGKIVVSSGTYTMESGSFVLSNSNISLVLSEGCTLNNTTATDYTIKITGDSCSIQGPGTIQVPDSPAIASAGSAPLRKAVIWNTGNKTKITDLTFQNSISYAIFNEGGDNLIVNRNRFYGGYDTYDISDGSNHFAYYQDGGSNTILTQNYVEYYVMGFGSGIIAEAAGTKMVITDNIFDHLGQHPVYIASGGDYSVVSNNVQKDCGASFALTGTGIKCSNNNIHVDSTLWTAASTYQSAFSFRNATACSFTGNIITGKGYKVIVGIENLGSGTSLTDNLIADNVIYMTEGAAYSAIRVGSSGTTTLNQRNKVSGNNIYAPIGTVNYPLIDFSATAASQVLDCTINDNTVEAAGTTQCYGIKIAWGSGCVVRGNRIINRQTFDTSTNFYAIYLSKTHDTECDNNSVVVTEATNLALFGFYESGTNTETYNNRCVELSIQSAATVGNLYPYVVIAGNSTRVVGGKCFDPFNVDNEGTHYLRKGHILYLTASGGARNFNPGEAVYPLDYCLEIHNVDAANTITFDSTGIAAAIAAGKFGIFRYTGTAWSGGQVN